MPPGKLLIPLSYTAVLGGCLTLIGTSTNLLVDGVSRTRGLDAFTIFEVTPMAAIVAARGAIDLRVIAPRLLPERTGVASLLTKDRKARKFFTGAVIPPGSNLIGREATGVKLFKREGVRLGPRS